MKTGTIILLGLGALAVYEYSQLGVAAADVQILFDDVSIVSLSNIQITILVQNVSNANIELNSMALAVTMNGQSLGNVSLFPVVPITIQGNSEQPVTVQLTPNWLTIPGAVADLINSGNMDAMSFNATGTANINNIPLPINVTKSTT